MFMYHFENYYTFGYAIQSWYIFDDIGPQSRTNLFAILILWFNATDVKNSNIVDFLP